MKRRDFIAGTSLLMGAAFVRDSVGAPAGDDESVKQFIRDYYSVYFMGRDKKKYRAMLTDDYLLLENGELMDADADIAAMPAADSDLKRTDNFDFRQVKISRNIAYAVYFLKSQTNDSKNGRRDREWLESAILRRSGSGWKIALLHSTRIEKAAA